MVDMGLYVYHTELLLLLFLFAIHLFLLIHINTTLLGPFNLAIWHC